MLETKVIDAPQKTAFVETPTRKRKRSEALSSNAKDVTLAAQNAAACFTNAAFSSTPKKVFGRRRGVVKENTNPFSRCPYLEVKSIEDIANTKSVGNSTSAVVSNPYEVVRKPPKKKICEDSCFENPALNLDLPEKQFNPFEVVRLAPTPVKQCFVNEALNIRGSEAPSTLNPYEVHRHNILGIPKQEVSDVEYRVEKELSKPTELKIGLPFTPKVGYRIDFKGLPLAQLTPSKLLAEKLVFSPIVAAKKRSLDSVNEETTMDIGKELDLYQLELENSINEAKLRKHCSELVNTICVEQRVECPRKLTEINEADEEEIEIEQEEVNIEIIQKSAIENFEEKPVNSESESNKDVSNPIESVAIDNASVDVAYTSDSEDEDDNETFKMPSRFVRAYRPSAAPIIKENQIKSGDSKESLQSNKCDDFKTRASVKSIIRKSILKIMHPTNNEKKDEGDVELTAANENEKKPSNNNIINSIRQSLRRRAQKTPQTDEIKLHEVSIIDSSERVMKLKSFETQTEYMKIEHLTNERKHSLRNSLRRSTRDVMRHVFHKNQQDAYATQK